MGLWMIGLGVETWALRTQKPHYTLSHAFRSIFRTRHPVGKTALVVFWVMLSNWLVPHLLEDVEDLTCEKLKR